jgi:hypothetical protein
MGKMISIFRLAGFLLLASTIGARVEETEPVELARAIKFADRVVRVLPQGTDQTGFGLIVGERAGKIYIATPYHVAFGPPGRPSTLGPSPRIIFRSDRRTDVPARRLDGSPNDDLAAIEVVPPAGLTIPNAPVPTPAGLPRGTRVWNIGIGQDWDTPDRAGGLGTENPVNFRLRVTGLRTPAGASGGAAVTASGVIGIVLEDAGDYSLLLPIGRIVQVFTAWDLPVNLLTSNLASSARLPEISSFEYDDARLGVMRLEKGANGIWKLQSSVLYDPYIYIFKENRNFHGCNGAVLQYDERRTGVPRPRPQYPGSDPSLLEFVGELFVPGPECGRTYVGFPESGQERDIRGVVERRVPFAPPSVVERRVPFAPPMASPSKEDNPCAIYYEQFGQRYRPAFIDGQWVCERDDPKR